MRILTKPSTARCNIEKYVRYLLSEPVRTTCAGLSDVLADTSHDSINRFLFRENYTPKDLFNDVREKAAAFNILSGYMMSTSTTISLTY